MDLTLFDERQAWIDHEAADILQERKDAAMLDACPWKPCGHFLCAEYGPKDCRNLKPVKAGDLMEEAIEWIDANRGGWVFIVAHTRADVLLGRRVAIKRYLEELRDDPTIAPGRDGETVKLKNALSAPFGRIVAAWYEELAPYVPLHQSKCDGCVVTPCPAWAVKL